MVGKQLVQFDVENKTRRSGVAPSAHKHRIGDGVKSGIDFNHVKMLGIPAEAIGRTHLSWIPKLDEPGIRPTSRSDENPCSHATTVMEAAHLLNLAAKEMFLMAL